MSLLKSIALTGVAIATLSIPAMADWHGHYYCGGPRFSIGIGVPLFVPPPVYYYPPPAYYPYYEPAPVVVGRPVAGDVVVDAQRVLSGKGYYHGVVDGALGPQTREAIRLWQADCHLPVTGQLDARTLRSLALL